MMVQVTVHAMAVKYGGKFVDSFLKGIGLTLFTCNDPRSNLGILKLECCPVFDFLQAHYNTCNELIIHLVR